MAGSWMTAGLGGRTRRLVAAAVAIVLSAAFLTTVLVATGTMKSAVEDGIAAGVRDVDLVVVPGEEPLGPKAFDEVAALDGVARVGGETLAFPTTADGMAFYTASIPAGGATLLSGRMPTALDEIAVTQASADDGTAVGSRVRVVPSPGPDDRSPTPVELLVVGVVDPGLGTPVSMGPGAVATDATLRRLDGGLAYETLQLHLADGADAQAVRDEVARALPGTQLRTGAEEATVRVSGLTGGTDVLAGVLLGFGAVALATAAIVIANTFTITVAQRTAELALLRCVGATRQQVRRQVLLESLLLGLVSSALGVALGVAAAAGLLAVGRRSEIDLGGMPLGGALQVTPLGVVLPLVVGTLVTVLAALVPATRATRVSPLAALRPSEGEASAGRSGLVRGLAGLLLVLGGTVIMVVFARHHQLVPAVLGGLVSFAGVLLAAVVVVPLAVRALGVVARASGVPGRLAVDNAVRNPGRAAATSAALLVGVTLITMTTVGAATGERTAMGEMDDAYAADLVLTAPTLAPSVDSAPAPVPAATMTAVAAVDGVERTQASPAAYLSLGEQEVPTLMLGLGPGSRGVLRDSANLDALRPGTIGLGNLMQAVHGLEPGSTVEVSGPGGHERLTVVEVGMGDYPVLADSDLERLGGDAVTATGGLLVRADERADLGELMKGVDEAAALGQDVTVTGSLLDRATITRVLDVLVLVAVGLLAVAVVIAVVGITNTLSLSVLERGREHALLRGMGLTRGQLRSMLLTEGVLLAVVSTVLGLALGLLYARWGIESIVPIGTEVRLAVPWARLGVVAGLALAAGLVAAVLPARNAARVAPAQGLTAV